MSATNPYTGMALFKVITPSGSELHLQTSEESDWYENNKRMYLTHNKFTNVSDLQELDRLLMLEVMVYRWSQWLTQGFDYQTSTIEPGSLQKNIGEYCVDEETEILTGRGWMRFTDIVPGDLALTLNVETGESEWQQIETVHTFMPSDPLVRMSSRDHSSLTTKNHRWWVERATKARGIGTKKWLETQEFDRYCWIPTSAPHGDFSDHPKYSDSLVELIAWWWTEGSCSRPDLYHGEIAQSHRVNPTHVDSIRRALRHELGEPGPIKQGTLWNEKHYGDKGMTFFKIAKPVVEALESHAPDKTPSPEFLRSLTRSQLSLFIEKSIDADGWRVDGKYAYLSQRERKRTDAFQIALLLAGFQANIYWDEGIEMWRVGASGRSAARPRHIEDVTDYAGLVWCPETPNSTWLARRDGKAFFTGNSKEIRQVKTALGIDRATREKDKGETLAEYIMKLQQRAKEFGYHRNEQYETAVTKIYELKSMIQTFDRCDDEERKELDLSEESIIQWIRDQMVAKWDEIEDSYRKNQAIWVRDL